MSGYPAAGDPLVQEGHTVSDKLTFPSHVTIGLRRAADRVGSWAVDPVAPLALGLGFAFVAIVLQLVAPVNQDLGWLLIGTRRMLDGSQLYVDGFLDVNPPLVLVLLSPAVIAARESGLAELDVVRGYVLLWCAVSLGLCAVLVREFFDPSERACARYFLAGLIFIFGVWPAVTGDEPMAFGQREHFVVLFLLPYVLLIALRLRSRAPTRSVAIAAGLMAGVALGMKPHYVPTIVVLECWLLFQRGSLRALRRPESCALVFVGVTYLGGMLLLAPAYFATALPLALDTYWAYQEPLASLVTIRSASLLGLAIVAVPAARSEGAAALARVLCIASLGSYAAYLLGGTTWAYHRLPYSSIAILVVLLGLAGRLPTTPSRSGRERGFRPFKAVALIAISALVALVVWQAPWQPGKTLRSYGPGGTSPGWTPSPALHATVERHAPGGTLLVLSTSLVFGFPLVNHDELEWTLRMSCLWPLPAVHRTREGRGGDRLSPIRAEAIDRSLRELLVHDMRARPPDLVFVHRGIFKQGLGRDPLDFVAYFRTDPAFAELWLGFEYVERLGTIDVYRRRGGLAGSSNARD